jgi:hypothetical protein
MDGNQNVTNNNHTVLPNGGMPTGSNTNLSRKRRMADDDDDRNHNFSQQNDTNFDRENVVPRAAKRFRPAVSLQNLPTSSTNPLPDITNHLPNSNHHSSHHNHNAHGHDNHHLGHGSSNVAEQKRSRKRGRESCDDHLSPKHKNAKVALFSILGEAGMLAASPGGSPSKEVPMITMDGQLADPNQIVKYHKDAHALMNGSTNPQHLERLATLMSDPLMIKQLYDEFCSRLARPVDITAAWRYFVQELSSYIHSQCQSAGRTDVSMSQVEDFIKRNWFTITQANSKALTGQDYAEVFPSAQRGAIVLPHRRPSTSTPRCFDLDDDVDMG